MKHLNLDKHFAAAAAAAAALCAAGAANAAIVTWNSNLAIPANIDGLYINVETQQTGSSGASVAGWDINPFGSTTLSFYSPVGYIPYVRTESSGPLSSLALGTTISSASSFTSSTLAAIDNTGVGSNGWMTNAINYFGFRFKGADNQERYGYGVMQVGATATTRTLLSVAYESTAGASIAVGAVPAPGAIALLGLAGLAGRRRRG
jgi:MYXO-CTERM domain-containing protein